MPMIPHIKCIHMEGEKVLILAEGKFHFFDYKTLKLVNGTIWNGLSILWKKQDIILFLAPSFELASPHYYYDFPG